MTSASGRPGVPLSPSNHPLERGFDEFFGFLGGSHDYLMDWRPDNLLQRNRTSIGATDKKPDDSRYLTTALAISGTAAPAGVAFDGVNLVPFLTGESTGDPHDILLWRMSYRHIWAARMGDDKVIMQAQGKAPHPTSKTPRLVNLASDLKELTDRSITDAARFKEITARYDAWSATLPEPLWQPEKGDK